MRVNSLYSDFEGDGVMAKEAGTEEEETQQPDESIRRAPRLSIVPLHAIAARPAAAWVAVQLLIDLPWSQFAARTVQSYFLRELASELDISAERLRVTSYDRSSGEVTVTCLPAAEGSGEAEPASVVKALLDMIHNRTLTIDPQFGDIVFVRSYTQEDAAAEALGEEPDGQQYPSSALASGLPRRSSLVAHTQRAAAMPSAPRAAAELPRRLLLLSHRTRGWEALKAGAQPGVIVIDFSHEHGTVEGVLHAVSAALGGVLQYQPLNGGAGTGSIGSQRLPRGVLRSIGILSPHKPGAVGLVRGHRLSVAHVSGQPAVRAALSHLTGCLSLERNDGLHLLHWPQAMSARDSSLVARLQELCCCSVEGGAHLSGTYIQGSALRAWQASYPQPTDRFTPSTRNARRAATAAASTRLQSAEDASLRLAAARSLQQNQQTLSTAAGGIRTDSAVTVPRLPLERIALRSDDDAAITVKDDRLNAPRIPLRQVQLPPGDESTSSAQHGEEMSRVWAMDEGIQRARAREETGIWAAPTRPMPER
jgi:hypothetical protein